eukprot:gene851-806_t
MGSTPKSPKEAFYAFYDVDSVTKAVLKSGFRRVALQFPDDLLADAPGVVRALTEHSQKLAPELKLDKANRPLFFVAGDTNFGACCVDEVSADHYGADVVVHFGPSCQSSTSRLPCIYVFGARATSNSAENHIENVVSGIRPEADSSKVVVVICEVGHDHLREKITNSLIFSGKFESVRVAPPKTISWPSHPKPGVDGCFSDVALAAVSSCGAVGSAYAATILRNERNKKVVGRENLPWAPRFCSGLKDDDKNDLVYHDPNSICGRNCYTAIPIISTKHKAHELILSENPIPENSTIIYVGPRNDPLRTRLLLRYASSNKLLVIDPSEICPPDPENAGEDLTTPRAEEIQPEQPFSLQMKRFRCVEAAKSAELFGVVYGTTGVSHCDKVVKRVNEILLSRGRRVYNLVVGDVNISKLGNFPEMECYVHVACPENQWALSVSTRDYPVPIITPFELEVAMDAREWSTEYVTEFSELLSQKPKDVENIDEDGNQNVQVLGGSAKVKNFKLDGDEWERFFDKLMPHEDKGYAGIRLTEEIPEPGLPVQGDHGVASCYTNRE